MGRDVGAVRELPLQQARSLPAHAKARERRNCVDTLRGAAYLYAYLRGASLRKSERLLDSRFRGNDGE